MKLMDALLIKIEQKAVSSLNLEARLEAGAALIAALIEEEDHLEVAVEVEIQAHLLETGTRVIEVEAEVDVEVEARPEGVVVEVTAEEEAQEVADVAVEEEAAVAGAAGAEGEKSEKVVLLMVEFSISSFYLIKSIVYLISYPY